MTRTFDLASVEERLTRIETNLAHWTDAQKESAQALSKVGDAIHSIQLTIERQNSLLSQVGDVRRDIDSIDIRVSKLEGRIWWIGGIATACTFIIVNLSRIKDFFN